MNSKLFIPTFALLVAGATAFGTSPVFAQDLSDSTHSKLVQRIAEKFNLQQQDVQAVFDEVKNEREVKRLASLEERLSKAVADGKLSETQKQSILTKYKELMDKRKAEWERLRQLSPEERRAEMEKARTELETWAKENNIDLKYLLTFKVGRHHGGMKWKDKH